MIDRQKGQGHEKSIKQILEGRIIYADRSRVGVCILEDHRLQERYLSPYRKLAYEHAFRGTYRDACGIVREKQKIINTRAH